MKDKLWKGTHSKTLSTIYLLYLLFSTGESVTKLLWCEMFYRDGGTLKRKMGSSYIYKKTKISRHVIVWKRFFFFWSHSRSMNTSVLRFIKFKMLVKTKYIKLKEVLVLRYLKKRLKIKMKTNGWVSKCAGMKESLKKWTLKPMTLFSITATPSSPFMIHCLSFDYTICLKMFKFVGSYSFSEVL